ncbi:hypothetical protein BN946_scf184723.g5 [Trametes cinnabarina]|uniref:Integrase zinc-binding domain-containing protein n=1 Tax=Pycnoporus cinnabarinus TaxID=5643 RepID=A0A060SZK8_PYCCI|nr:hypothetical protein BN946_scf184723.g5 [Trametes cinnabarina]
MGWSNSVPIFHDDVTYILRPEIPHITVPYIDDVPCKGPESDYHDEGGTYKTITANPGIRRFVWEHFANINHIVQRMKYAGGTFSGTKSILCARKIMVVGHHCTPEGCLPDESRVAAIKKWGPCHNLSEVRAFLGTIGVARIFIHNFAKHAHPLVQLTQKGVPFEFGEAQLKAMEDLKQVLLESPALRAINYESPAPVILAVDTSYIAVGYHLAQCDEQKPQIRYYSHFGSITLNECELCFLQPKLELYGLFRALQATKLYLIGIRNLVVEVDARSIKGILNNPDLAPSASMNCWILAILTFHFRLVHVPGTSHGPDSLSRRLAQPGDDPVEDPNEFEDWIDCVHGFLHMILPLPAPWRRWERDPAQMLALADATEDGHNFSGGEENDEEDERAIRVANRSAIRIASETEAVNFAEPEGEVAMPYSEQAKKADEWLQSVEAWLRTLMCPDGLSDTEYATFVCYAQNFFSNDRKLWRKSTDSAHKLVVWPEKQLDILRTAHDRLGHRGQYATSQFVSKCFWWPTMQEDVTWYVRTCHLCQVRQHRKVLIPPTVMLPGGLGMCWYIDSMKMPASNGYRIIVIA